MNKRLLVGLFSAFMAMAPWCGNAAETQNIDAPHLNLTDSCENCHFAGLEPGDCTVRCHTTNVPPYNDTVAPIAATHQGLTCQACHNPHVSLQTGGIAGEFAGVTYDAPSDRSTLTGVTPTPDPIWAAKTSAERGMILWVPVTGGVTNEKASYEVKAIDATAGTVTVKGNMTTASRTFELRRGQLIAKAVTRTAGESYKVGTLAVQFPASATQPFVDATNKNGICQVCHTSTNYWLADGSGVTHNAELECTSCHRHDSGFLVTGCNACHQGVGEDGVPVDMPGMSVPSTGSITAGQHQVHAVDYAFPCATCHVGTGMDRINDPLHPIADGKIQIGFNWGKFMGYLTSYDGQSSVVPGQANVVYEGTNHTKVTNGGTMTCGTVYCHSDGVAIRKNCATSTTNTTPKWNGSSADPQADTVKCNNCHGFQNTSGAQNVITSGKHLLHVSSRKIGCYVCHAGTAQLVGGATPGSNIQGLSELLPNKGNHANTAYDIMASGLWGGQPIVLDSTLAAGAPGKWDPVTKTCVTLCHTPANRTSNMTWTATDTATCPNACLTGNAGNAVVNTDPVLQGFSAYSTDSNTLVLSDTSIDLDANDPVSASCLGGGHSNGNGYIRINWGNEQVVLDSRNLRNIPTTEEYVWRYSDNYLTTHGNTLEFQYYIFDNDVKAIPNLQTGKVGGWADAGWKSIDKVAVALNDPYKNIIPISRHTQVGKVDRRTVDLTIYAYDPDFDTRPSNVDWTGVDKNAYNNGGVTNNTKGGHNGGQGAIKINWNAKALTPTHMVSLTATEKAFTYHFVYPVQEPAGGTWINYFVADNHYIQKSQNTNNLYNSGWFACTFTAP